MYTDPQGLDVGSAVAGRMALAGACAAADGPLPIGDVIAAGIIGYTGMQILMSKGAPQSEKRPRNTLPGTRGIDDVKGKYGLDTDDVHGIKAGVGNGARDWTGVAPDGTVGINDGEGNWEPVGKIGDLVNR